MSTQVHSSSVPLAAPFTAAPFTRSWHRLGVSVGQINQPCECKPQTHTVCNPKFTMVALVSAHQLIAGFKELASPASKALKVEGNEPSRVMVNP